MTPRLSGILGGGPAGDRRVVGHDELLGQDRGDGDRLGHAERNERAGHPDRRHPADLVH